jgi:hypothetical protein
MKILIFRAIFIVWLIHCSFLNLAGSEHKESQLCKTVQEIKKQLPLDLQDAFIGVLNDETNPIGAAYRGDKSRLSDVFMMGAFPMQKDGFRKCYPFWLLALQSRYGNDAFEEILGLMPTGVTQSVRLHLGSVEGTNDEGNDSDNP